MEPKKHQFDPASLWRALREARMRHGCMELEKLDAIALADTGGQKETNKLLAAYGGRGKTSA